jgi:hypothetical protein
MCSCDDALVFGSISIWFSQRNSVVDTRHQRKHLSDLLRALIDSNGPIGCTYRHAVRALVLNSRVADKTADTT